MPYTFRAIQHSCRGCVTYVLRLYKISVKLLHGWDASEVFLKHAPTPNLPTKIFPTKISEFKLSGKSPMDLGIPPLLPESNKPSEIQNLSTQIGRIHPDLSQGSAPPPPIRPFIGSTMVRLRGQHAANQTVHNPPLPEPIGCTGTRTLDNEGSHKLLGAPYSRALSL